ncbi:MAG: hypothetical protein ACI37Z_01130 [Candidatus Gastranaerophilaceae bacterium]
MNNEIFEQIQQKAKKLGVVVDFTKNDIIDFGHLDSTWYYNRECVASITKKIYGQQYELLIVPNGEISLYGCIAGEEAEFKNKEVDRLRIEYGFNDEKLQEYSITFDPNDYLDWDNNNWFAARFVVNDNVVSTYDEILDFDILEVMNDLEGLVELLDKFIQNYRLHKIKGGSMVNKGDIIIFRSDGYGDYDCRINTTGEVLEVSEDTNIAFCRLDNIDGDENVCLWVPVENLAIVK